MCNMPVMPNEDHQNVNPISVILNMVSMHLGKFFNLYLFFLSDMQTIIHKFKPYPLIFSPKAADAPYRTNCSHGDNQWKDIQQLKAAMAITRIMASEDGGMTVEGKQVQPEDMKQHPQTS